MKDVAIATCPADQCARKPWGKGKVQRQIGTGAGIIFKGSGFYTTDYRSEGYKAAAKQESLAPTSKNPSPSTTPAAGGTAGKTDTGSAKAPPASGTKSKPAST